MVPISRIQVVATSSFQTTNHSNSSEYTGTATPSVFSDIGKAQPLVGVMGYTDEESGLERGRPQVRTQNPQIQGILDNFSGGVGYTGNTPGDNVMVMPDYGPNPVSGHNSGQADKDAYDAYLREKDEKDRAKGIYGVKNYKGTRQKSRFGTAYGGYGLPRTLVGEGDNSKLHPTTIANKFRDTKHYLNQRPKTKPETKDRIQMSGDDPFELAMSVLKNAADYDVDMSSDAYLAVGGARGNNDLVFGFIYATGSIRLLSRDNTGGASVDQAAGIVVYGDQ
mgnify:CR=1 FL=1